MGWNTSLVPEVKEMYGNHCQVCGLAVAVKGGSYSVGAHIRPLGRPHNGTDAMGNILCLCPNHHVMFDMGGFTIGEDLVLVGIVGRLLVDDRHGIGMENIRYHREHYG